MKSSKTFPTAILAASFVIILAGMMQAQSIINPILMGLFLSIISAQPILWLQKKKVPLGIAILMVIFFEVLIFIGLAEVIGSSVADFSNNSGIYEEKMEKIWMSFIATLNENGIQISGDNLSKIINPSKLIGFTSIILNQLGGVIGNTFTIFFLMLFLLLELESFSLKTKAISKSTHVSLEFLDTIGTSIRTYLSIKTMTSLLTGFIIWICLLILGVEYAIIWALIAFLLNFIPNIGSIIAALPAVLFALIQLGFSGALWTGVIFLAINIFVGNVVEPKMMGKGLGLSTYVVFVSLIFWGFILGIVGMFLSVPLTMAIKIMLDQNKNTKWIAVLLGTEEDAKSLLS